MTKTTNPELRRALYILYKPGVGSEPPVWCRPRPTRFSGFYTFILRREKTQDGGVVTSYKLETPSHAPILDVAPYCIKIPPRIEKQAGEIKKPSRKARDFAFFGATRRLRGTPSFYFLTEMERATDGDKIPPVTPLSAFPPWPPKGEPNRSNCWLPLAPFLCLFGVRERGGGRNKATGIVQYNKIIRLPLLIDQVRTTRF